MYQITVSNDGAPIQWSQNYADELEAHKAFAKFIDWGFADKYSTVNLMTPTGKMYTKIFYREGRRVVER